MKFTKDEIRERMLLYAVTDRAWLKEGQPLAEAAEAALKGGATFLQIREKELPQEVFEAEAYSLKALCERYGVPYVVNDSVEIAMRIDADGVHVGQTDIKGRDIRGMIGADKIMGVSVRTVEEALAAQQAGADYIGVGAVFYTSTKKNAGSMSKELLRKIVQSVDIPVVAIGGINRENILELEGTGVDGVALVSAIFGAEDIETECVELKALAGKMIKG